MKNKKRGGDSHQNHFVQLAELLQQFMSNTRRRRGKKLKRKKKHAEQKGKEKMLREEARVIRGEKVNNYI